MPEKYKYINLSLRVKTLNTEFDNGFIMKTIRIFFTFLDGLDIFTVIKWLLLDYFFKKKKEGLKKIKDIIVDTIVLFKFILAILIFYFGWHQYSFVKFLIFYLAITTFSSIPSAILQSKVRPTATSYMRATVLGIFNYIELVFYFASLYAGYHCLGYIYEKDIIEAQNKIDFLYFSFITVSTIGFGHVKIIAPIGYWFVISQAFIFLMFVLIFFNINLSRISNYTN